MATIYTTEFLNEVDENISSVIKELQISLADFSVSHNRIPNPPGIRGYSDTCYTHCLKCTLDRNLQKLIDIKVNLECGV